jgi:hypothetical protein
MQKVSIVASTVGTLFSAALMAESPLQAKTLDIPSPDSPNPQSPKSQPIQQLNIPNDRRYIAPPEQISSSPITIAQTFQLETNNTTPIWNTESTSDQPSSNWQIEITETSRPPSWAASPYQPNTDLAQQIPEPINLNNAESPTNLTPEELKLLQTQLDSYEEAPKAILQPYRASPGITLGIPSGFGSDRGKISVGLGLQRTRANTNDGAGSVSIGLGNAQTGIGVQLSYTSYSISPEKLFKKGNRTIEASDRPFGSGGFNLKIHRRFSNDFSVAIGADSIFNIGPTAPGAFGEVQNELEGTYYAAATKLFRLKEDANESFSRLSVTVGAGLGPRFQPVDTVREDRKVITPFVSAALKISPAASLITEWSGQDLGIGLSWVPFRNLPIVLTPAIRDIFGPDATKPRFVMGFGLGF